MRPGAERREAARLVEAAQPGQPRRGRTVSDRVGRRPVGVTPADDARAAAVRDDRGAGRRAARSSSVADLRRVDGGRATASGTAPSRPAAERDPVGQALAAGVPDAASGSAEGGGRAPSRSAGTAPTTSARSASGDGRPWPTMPSRSPMAGRGIVVAIASSPQPFQRRVMTPW